MKTSRDHDILIAELVRANTAALSTILGHMSALIAATQAVLVQTRPPAVDAATRKVPISQELLTELKGRPPGVRNG